MLFNPPVEKPQLPPTLSETRLVVPAYSTKDRPLFALTNQPNRNRVSLNATLIQQQPDSAEKYLNNHLFTTGEQQPQIYGACVHFLQGGQQLPFSLYAEQAPRFAWQYSLLERQKNSGHYQFSSAAYSELCNYLPTSNNAGYTLGKVGINCRMNGYIGKISAGDYRGELGFYAGFNADATVGMKNNASFNLEPKIGVTLKFSP